MVPFTCIANGSDRPVPRLTRMPRALKVFRTSTGFHDAYVAAPSRAAALRAWGSDNDLFARGAAEEITDPELMAEPLAHPGEVIRRSRGSLEDQLAALPKSPEKVAAPHKRDRSEAPAPATKRKPKSKPRPSRTALDRAEAAAKTLDAEQRAGLEDLSRREAALRAERRAMEASQAKARNRSADRIDEARAVYDDAVAQWRSEA